MLKLLTTTALCAIALGAYQAKASESHEYARSGAWVNYWVRADNGQLGCGMRYGGAASSMHVKWFVGQPALQVHLFKDSWQIPSNREVLVEMGVDGYSLGEAKASGETKVGRGWRYGVVVFYVGEFADSPGKLREFLEGFRDAKKLWVRFPYGTEAPWVLDMTGSRDAVATFSNCITRIAPKQAPQPFGREPETSQPFGKEPPATSPVAPAVTGRDRSA